MPDENPEPCGHEGASNERSDQWRLVQFHHRAVRGPRMPPLASQRNGVRRIQAALAFRGERQLHAVKTGAVVVMVIATIGRAIPVVGVLVTAAAIAVGMMDGRGPMIMGVGVTVRFRTTHALADHSAEQAQVDQQAEDDDAGGTHAVGASVSPGETESQGLYSTRSRLCGQARTFRLLRKVAVDAARDDVAGGFVEIVVEQLGEFEKLRP